MVKKWKELIGNMTNEEREPGQSTAPGETYMDKVQDEVQETGHGPEGESMNIGGSFQHASDPKESQPVTEENTNQVEVDKSPLEAPDPDVDVEPKQVEPETVIYVPRKDFEARVNQEDFKFRTGVPTKVSRDLANQLLQDEDRGYVRD